jgi:hypothetical protein
MPLRIRRGFYRFCRDYEYYNPGIYGPPLLWFSYQALVPALILVLAYPARLVLRILRRIAEKVRAA